jgi:hypothetical protein
MTRATIQTDAGTEIRCTQCGEYWPRDPEFFFYFAGKPHSWCKACYLSDPQLGARRRSAQARRAARRADAAQGTPGPDFVFPQPFKPQESS